MPSAILRCPCAYPPDKLRGRLLAGLGVPDLRGGVGTPTFFTSDPGARAGDSEILMRLRPRGGRAQTRLKGPGLKGRAEDAEIRLKLEIDGERRAVQIKAPGWRRSVLVDLNQWSPWLRVRFRLGPLQSAHGVVRFRLLSLEPHLELYASPVNFHPRVPLFPISHPWDYAGELDRALGTFYTAGFVEDHTGLSNGRLDESAFLEQCALVMAERTSQLHYELDRLDEGLLYCLFDTPDRIQHLFWRFTEPDHPANRGQDVRQWAGVIDRHYQECDAVVGEVLQRADEHTLVIVLSDHGFSSYQRGLHLNTWLHDQGLLALKDGAEPGEAAGDFFRFVDWERTRAYSLGLGGIYLNRREREAFGTLDAESAREVEERIISGLSGLPDPHRGTEAVVSVARARDLYRGPFVDRAPDLLPLFAAGYRSSWATTLGGVPEGHFEDNLHVWSGDHVIHPSLVPGVLFLDRPCRGEGVSLTDLAPTILEALGVPVPPEMEGRSLLDPA